MKKSLIITGCLAMASLFIGCGSEGSQDTDASSTEDTLATETSSATEEEWEPEMYETSELAGLMRQMYADNMALKEMVEQGKVPQSFPEDFYTIHTAQATDPDELDESFKIFADQYLKDMEAIVDSDPASVKMAFNKMVNTCVNCHQLYCQGPIPKIKKLMVEE
ncbi:MAG: hypothetical protein LPK80_09235 [Bacteroidota bacterium]|nr:hypothetical protein [Bacteroidota bacterium]